MSEVIELARFTVRAGDEEAFLAKRGPMVDAAKASFPGLKRIELVKLEDGTWVDVVVWESEQDAAYAVETASSIPAVAEWLAHVDRDVSMDRGAIHDSVVVAA